MQKIQEESSLVGSPIQHLFYKHLLEYEPQSEFTKKVIASGLTPDDPEFPLWTEYFDKDETYAGLCGMTVKAYRKKYGKA